MSQDLPEGPGASFRPQRLRWSWVLAPPYLLLAQPSPESLLAGALIGLPGLLLRAWSAGFIHKEVELATDGPYRFVRHPLYTGSFLLGLGLAVAAGRWWFVPLFGALFGWVYRRALKAEDRTLEHRFGSDYLAYRDQVPAFLPRFGPRNGIRAEASAGPGPRSKAGSQPVSGDGPVPGSRGFRSSLYRRNREWEATLGVLAGFALLWMKMMWLG